MARAKILIPKSVLIKLYVRNKLSPAKIGIRYGCDAVTVRTRIKEAGIPLKTKSAAQSKYAKKNFCGNDHAKAYMLGFRYGDLNVYQPHGLSETVVVRCHTTHEVQRQLFKKVFGKYGHITVSRNSRSMHLNCYLNESFNFLLGKYHQSVREWLSRDDSLFWAFSAGYTDAEGNFGLNQDKGRFKIDAYDYAILLDMHKLLLRYGIRSKFRVIARKGENDYGWVWKQDVWRLSVNEASSLEKLIKFLSPYLIHKKRIADARGVLKNVVQRRRHGTIR